MCIFSQRVEHVAQTKIFARAAGGEQFLAYEMAFSALGDLAMVLPVPVVPGSGEQALRFIDLSSYRVLGPMRQRGWGRIVQVTSGIRDQPELMAYAASKAALDKFVLDTVPSLRGSGVLMNLLDPGWLRTDLGGPDAPNAVESVLPGALVPALVGGEVHGVLFRAQDYARGTV